MSVSYIGSDAIQVFPAGFRSQEFADSRLTTEQNLTRLKRLSAYAKYNNYFNEDPYVSGGYIIGICGYVFNIAEDSLPANAKYAYIKLRTLSSGFEVLDNLENTGEVLDDTDSQSFCGLGFTDEDQAPSGTGIHYVKLDMDKYQPLKLSSYEIADKETNNSIANTLHTENIIAETAEITNLTYTNLTSGDGDTFSFGNPKRYLKIENRALEIGLYNSDNSVNPKSRLRLVSTSTADAVEGDPNPETTIKFSQSMTFPKKSAFSNVALVQYDANSTTLGWKGFTTSAAANTLVARDENRDISAGTAYLVNVRSSHLLSTNGDGKIEGKSLTDYTATTNTPGFVKVAKEDTSIVATQTSAPSSGVALGLQIDANGKAFTVLQKANTAIPGGIKASPIGSKLQGYSVASSGQIVRLQCDNEGTGFVTIPANANIAVPEATSGRIGGVKTGFTSSDASRNYALVTDESGNGYVHVPWESGGGGGSSTIPLASASTIGGIRLGFTSGRYSNICPVEVDVGQRAYTVVPMAGIDKPGVVRVVGTVGLDITSMEPSDQEYALPLPLYANESTLHKKGGRGLVFLPIARDAQLGGVKAVRKTKLVTDVELCVDDSGVAFMPRAKVSDIRLKENIVDFKSDKSILDLPIKRFDFKNGAKNEIGCIAQDLQKLYPELVVEDDEGYLSIEETKLIYPLIEEVKKLKTEIVELKSKLNLLD